MWLRGKARGVDEIWGVHRHVQMVPNGVGLGSNDLFFECGHVEAGHMWMGPH